jgi:hypothetical protein
MQETAKGLRDEDHDAAREAAGLGEPIETFVPGFANLFAGVVLGLLAAGGGLTILVFLIREIIRAGGQLPLIAEKEPSWVVLGVFALLGGVLIVGAAWLAYWVKSTLGSSIKVCPGGMFSSSPSKVHWVAPWGEIEGVREMVTHEHLPIVKGIARHAMPVRTNRTYAITRRNTTELVFTGNEIKEIGRFGDLLRVEAQARQIPWAVVEVRD